MTDQVSLFDMGDAPARSTARECPACGGALDSFVERREGRCRRCIASGAEALRLISPTACHVCGDDAPFAERIHAYDCPFAI